MINIKPKEAWLTYLKYPSEKPNWMEDSHDISDEMKLSKRELFGLLILSAIANHLSKEEDWSIGYDKSSSEPNDGFISNGNIRLDIEHKLASDWLDGESLEGILSTYEKYSIKGSPYGSNRTLIIYPNKPTRGLIKMSELKKKIAENPCPFDNVLLINASSVKRETNEVVIHATEYYPSIGMAEVVLNMTDGTTKITSCALETFPSLVKKVI